MVLLFRGCLPFQRASTTMHVKCFGYHIGVVASVARLTGTNALSTSQHTLEKLTDASLLSFTGPLSKDSPLKVFNPASTEEELANGQGLLATVESMRAPETKRAIDIAHAALENWRDQTTGVERSQMLKKWADLIKQNAEDLGTSRILALHNISCVLPGCKALTYKLKYLFEQQK